MIVYCVSRGYYKGAFQKIFARFHWLINRRTVEWDLLWLLLENLQMPDYLRNFPHSITMSKKKLQALDSDVFFDISVN